MRVFSVIGPSHAGKSTLIEGLAGIDSSRKQKLVLDGDGSVTKFSFMDEDWAALEVPGGPDNMALLGPVLSASDAAVLCVSADADGAVLAAPYLRVLEENGLPTLIYVNKLDTATDRVSDIVAALQVYCAHGMVLRQVPIREGDKVVGAVDLISERDGNITKASAHRWWNCRQICVRARKKRARNCWSIWPISTIT